MKNIYENFSEIGEHFKSGDSWTHKFSDHTPDECFPWQHGVIEFAKFLDGIGLKIVQNTEIYEKLWDNFESFKPEILAEHTNCTNKEGK